MTPEHRKTLEEAENLLSYYSSKKSPTACGEVAKQLRDILSSSTTVATVDVESLLDRYADAHKALDAIGAPPKVNPDGVSVARSVAERIELWGKALSDAKNSDEEAAHDARENERWVRDAHAELDFFGSAAPRSCGIATHTLAGRIAELRKVQAIEKDKFRKTEELQRKLTVSYNSASNALSCIAVMLGVGSEWARAERDDHEIVKVEVKKLITDRDAHKNRANALEQRAKAAEAKAAYGPYDVLLLEEVARRREAEASLAREQAAHNETKSRKLSEPNNGKKE